MTLCMSRKQKRVQLMGVANTVFSMLVHLTKQFEVQCSKYSNYFNRCIVPSRSCSYMYQTKLKYQPLPLFDSVYLGHFNCNSCFTGIPDKNSGSVGRFEKKKKQSELLISYGSNLASPSLRSPQVYLSTRT